MNLIGNNLGERHKYLNSKVTEAIDKQENFEKLKSQPESSDIDKLFKIDLASKYKNIDYILEVLKGGDVFHMTRALKCLWLYSDDYAQFINADYLHANIFPYMSMKMKKKMLTAVSVHMRNADRHVQFYRYCVDARLSHYADKFLIFTPDSFKLSLLKNKNMDNLDGSKYLKQFIGSSFELALAYLSKDDNNPNDILYELRFLYFVSKEDYLNILEKYTRNSTRYPNCSQPLGARISKDILKIYKQRISNKPLLYINKLNKSVLTKCLTIKDVETLAEKLLPDSSEDFWGLDFYNTYKFILAKLPADKLYNFIRHIYMTKYNDNDFEMKIEFYELEYYEMLNIDEREAWALQHIDRDKELPGIKNYIWYKFVNYRKAVSGIKRYIFLTPDNDERSRIVNILPETARNQDEINEILCYYYARHVNESEAHKTSFIDKVIELHDVYSFNNECWSSLDKLLYSLDVYASATFKRPEYTVRILFYHILHDMDLPEAIIEYIDSVTSFMHIGTYDLVRDLSEERKIFIAQYLLNYLVKKIEPLIDKQSENDNVKNDVCWEYGGIKSQINDEVCKVWDVIYIFNISFEFCPEIVVKFMESNMDVYKNHERYKIKFITRKAGDFLRWLKQDTETAVDAIDEIRCNTYRWNFRLSCLFKKLKVYFPNDVSKEYLNYFLDYLSDVPTGYREYRNVKMAVVGVFYLGDPENITCLLDKNTPTSPKIDRRNIDNRVLQVQKAICRLAYHSRPPIPLCYFQKYISGDYVHFCLPTIYNYFANLPFNDNFVETLLNTPLSIQKHGLRFACKTYDIDTLKPIIIDTWKKTKNVSLRMILYEALFDRILNENEVAQKELYEVLKLYTLELNHDDHDNVYALLVSGDFPDVLKRDFIEIAWLTVNKLSDKSTDTKRKISVIRHMENNMHLVRRDFPRFEIIDYLVNYLLLEQNIQTEYDDYYFGELICAKWDLTAKYIVGSNKKVEHQKSLELMQTIIVKCLESWNLVKNNTYVIQKFMKKFIKTIQSKDPKTVKSCANTVAIYRCILDNLRLYQKKEQIYLMDWDLNLSIICRDIIYDSYKKYLKETDEIRKTWNVSKLIADAYGMQIRKILIHSVQNGEFCRAFYQPIADIVNSIGCTVCDILNVDNSSFVYYVCDILIDIKMTETHLLALFILPRDPEKECRKEHCETIANIEKKNVSQEVRNFLYEKYVHSDYEVRLYVP